MGWLALVLLLLSGASLAQVPEVCTAKNAWGFELETSACVRAMQIELDSRTPPLTLEDPTIPMPLTPDGIFGAETTKAVKAFQHRWGLPEDGIAGPATLAFLFPDPPLVQLIQLDNGPVPGGEIAAHGKSAVSELLLLLKKDTSRGPTYRLLGMPVFGTGACGYRTFPSANTLLADVWLAGDKEVDFVEACNAHTVCYAELPKAEEHRLACDVHLLSDLRNACVAALGSSARARVCELWAAVYFVAARKLGNRAYLEPGVASE